MYGWRARLGILVPSTNIDGCGYDQMLINTMKERNGNLPTTTTSTAVVDEVLDQKGRPHEDHVGNLCGQRDGCEISDRVVAELLLKAGADGDRRRREENGATVRPRLVHGFAAHVATAG